MVLDVCASLPATVDTLRVAVDRTADWAARARIHHDRIEARPEGQALFGIVQGGTDTALRTESAERTVGLEFDGYGIGGLSVGEPRDQMLGALATTVPLLPSDRPRYLMGVGDPVGMMESIALGVDQFDCVAPTRAARHGSIWTSAGRLNLRNAVHARDAGPLDPDCPCPTCARYARGYLRHLLVVGEPTVWRLCSIHNLTYVLGLMVEARAAIVSGTLDSLVAVFNNGQTPEQIMQSFPTVDLADIYTVLGYYLRHRDEVDAYLEARDKEAEEIARTSPIFSKGMREKLLSRRAAQQKQMT